MAAKAHQDLPGAFLPDDEPNGFLRKFKSTRVSKWRLTSSASLWEMSDLATYLLALERPTEAIDVAGYPADRVQFRRDYNIWSPVSCCMNVRSHAQHILGVRSPPRKCGSGAA